MLTFTQFLNEGRPFIYQGKQYSAGYHGRYTKDGESISKEEYKKASEGYKSARKEVSKKKTIEKEYDGVKFTLDNKKKVEFYIETKDGFKKKEGKVLKLSNLPDYDFVMVKDKDGGYSVSERSTGLLLGIPTYSGNDEEAVDDFANSDAGKYFMNIDKEKFDTLVSMAKERQAKRNKPKID